MAVSNAAGLQKTSAGKKTGKRKQSLGSIWRNNWQLYVLIAPAVV